MKRMIGISILLLFAIVVFSGCADNSAADNADTDVEAEEDGYKTNHTDSNAPKTIESTEITDFSCYFSALAFVEGDTELEYDSYHLSAVWKDGVVSGSYLASTRYGEEVEDRFEADASFMEDLQEIVTKHDFARNNGLYVEVKGLPDNYGADLTVIYASGERILAHDNQDGFLSIAAMEALEELFFRKTAGTGKVGRAGKAGSAAKDSIGVLDLTLSKAFVMEDKEGCILNISYPVFALGYTQWDGQASGAEGYEALKKALDSYNRDIRMNQESTLHYGLNMAAEQIAESGDDPRELYSYVDAYVTRNDEQVVSFYEYVTEYAWWIEEQHYWAGYNYDAKTGRLLTYEDVFTEVGALPAFLTETLANAYPQLAFPDETQELIETAIREKTTSMGFALSHDCIHIFMADSWLGPRFEGAHLVLSYEDYPELVKEAYRPASADWLMELQYDTDYPLKDGTTLRLSVDMAPESWESVEWTVTVNGEDYTESFYGYKPQCWLTSSGGNHFLYVEVPTGDVSMLMNVYEIAGGGISLLDQIPFGMHKNVNMNPERMFLYVDDMVFADSFMLLPYIVYAVGEDGTPELIKDSEYRLESVPLTLQQDIRVREADREDADTVLGLTEVSAGEIMTAYRTDRQSYVDFVCADGMVCRFEIDGFSWDMNLGGFGTLDELFYGAPVS